MFKHILMPTDGSEHSERAIERLRQRLRVREQRTVDHVTGGTVRAAAAIDGILTSEFFGRRRCRRLRRMTADRKADRRRTRGQPQESAQHSQGDQRTSAAGDFFLSGWSALTTARNTSTGIDARCSTRVASLPISSDTSPLR